MLRLSSVEETRDHKCMHLAPAYENRDYIARCISPHARAVILECFHTGAVYLQVTCALLWTSITLGGFGVFPKSTGKVLRAVCDKPR